MSLIRQKAVQFGILVIGAYLVIENSIMLLQTLLARQLPPPVNNHFALTILSALLTILLIFALFSLTRSLTREKQLLLAETSQGLAEWQQTFNSMTDLVSVHDSDFRIVKANKALCEFLEMPPEAIIGRYCYQLFHDRDSPIDGCPHNKAQEAGHAVTLEVDDPHLAVPLLITCSPFVDSEGRFAGSVHMARIQTQRDTGARPAPAHFIPICASCKDIRTEDGRWIPIEDYVTQHCTGQLTHSLCKECQVKIYPEFFKE